MELGTHAVLMFVVFTVVPTMQLVDVSKLVEKVRLRGRDVQADRCEMVSNVHK